MANPTNKSYDGLINWATGSSNDIQAKNLITARNIKLTNSSNTQLATASFNGTADATLKLAATVPISISGNAATATTATLATGSTNIRVTDTNTFIGYPVMVSGNTANTNYSPTIGSKGMKFYTGAYMGKGSYDNAVIYLGNDTVYSSADGSMAGKLVLYCRGQYYGEIVTSSGLSANRTYTLPNKTGTLALTSDIPAGANPTAYLSATGGTSASTTWYRKYSDGFIIQGGLQSGHSAGGLIVTLPTAFTKTTYACVATYAESQSTHALNCEMGNFTTTKLSINRYTGLGGYKIFWLAWGY